LNFLAIFAKLPAGSSSFCYVTADFKSVHLVTDLLIFNTIQIKTACLLNATLCAKQPSKASPTELTGVIEPVENLPHWPWRPLMKSIQLARECKCLHLALWTSLVMAGLGDAARSHVPGAKSGHTDRSNLGACP
jgi:hypothetical protein